jgi:hypothetical protein
MLSVRDFARAIAIDADAPTMDDGVLDYDLFDCLRKWAEAEPARCWPILERYVQLMPSGAHKSDVLKWIQHIESDPRRA